MPDCRSPINPIRELSVIIKSELPIAIFISRPASKTKDGIIRNPPPAPTIEVNIPTKKPSKPIYVISLILLFTIWGFGLLFLIIMVAEINGKFKY